jgi:hypothetical protein
MNNTYAFDLIFTPVKCDFGLNLSSFDVNKVITNNLACLVGV